MRCRRHFLVNTSASADFAVNITVEKGDQIQIMLDPNGSNAGDATTLISKAVYVDPTDVIRGEIRGNEEISHREDAAIEETFTAHWYTSNGSEVTNAPCEWKLDRDAEGIRITKEGVLKAEGSAPDTVVRIQAVYEGGIVASRDVLVKKESGDYLSDLPWVSAEAGYGTVNKDKASAGTSIQLTGEDGKAVTYEKGLGTHASSKIVYDIKGKGYQAFKSVVGIDYSQNPDGFYADVVFKVFLNSEDTQPVFDSGSMVYDTPRKYVNVPLDESAETLILIVEEGEHNWSDHANWADAKLLKEKESVLEQLFNELKVYRTFYDQNAAAYTRESWEVFAGAFQTAGEILLDGEAGEEASREAFAQLKDSYEDLIRLIPVESVQFEHEILPLEVGRSLILSAAVLPENASDREVTWSSSDETIASVSQKGEVLGQKAGTVKITARSSNGRQAQCRLIVKKPASGEVEVQSISVIPSELELMKGKEAFLRVTVIPVNATDQSVIWTSDAPLVATVNINGKVTAQGPGEAVITAMSRNGRKAVCRITVKDSLSQVVYPNAIRISPAQAELMAGKDTVLKAVVLPENASDKSVKWKSDHPEVASVDQNGKVRGIKAGTAHITATASNALTASCRITVKAGPAKKASVKLSYKSIQLQKGKTTSVVKASGLIAGDRIKGWTSSKPSVVSVDKKGKIRGKKTGKATVTVTTRKGAKASCKVKVTKKPVKTKSIKTNVKKLNLKKGKRYQLNVIRKPATASDALVYLSSNQKIAVVSKKGKITAKKKGRCKISIKAASGKKAVVTLNVK